jgi:hypothetical protein
VLQNDSRFAQAIGFAEGGKGGQAKIKDQKLSLQVVSTERSEEPPLIVYRYQVVD